MKEDHRYFVLNKPHDMVSQFVSSHQVRTLRELDYSFPPGTHPIGRLDSHSEGLLLLTTNKRVTKLLFQGTTPHRRTYLVKVRYTVSAEAIEQLQRGVSIQVRGGAMYQTMSCEAAIIDTPGPLNRLPLETPDFVPFTWLRIHLTEGKFHQVRKMTSAIGHRCMRLIRVAIGDLTLGDLAPGAVREIPEEDFFGLIGILDWR